MIAGMALFLCRVYIDSCILCLRVVFGIGTVLYSVLYGIARCMYGMALIVSSVLYGIAHCIVCILSCLAL